MEMTEPCGLRETPAHAGPTEERDNSLGVYDWSTCLVVWGGGTLMRLNSEQPIGLPQPMYSNVKRSGIFTVLAAICLVTVMAFVALSVDLGVISLTKTRMQNACDAAALAAATEISNAVQQAGQDAGGGDNGGEGVQDPNS